MRCTIVLFRFVRLTSGSALAYTLARVEFSTLYSMCGTRRRTVHTTISPHERAYCMFLAYVSRVRSHFVPLRASLVDGDLVLYAVWLFVCNASWSLMIDTPPPALCMGHAFSLV
ncbi:hypothetical protein OF83DRAFT_385515 [Amylostereum chailletii]|nr:hypothetical protein OF83DRAFT_385515 [Amylostereum chailletii]